MARQINKLSPRGVATVTKPGRHSDGGGLYLVVDKGGSKRWVFIFRWRGKLKEMGLGGLTSVPQAKAREKAAAARGLVADGKNPIDEREQDKAVPTFGEVADAFVADLSSQWRNAKHRKQWSTTLKGYAAPLRLLPVDAVDTDAVLKVLKPLWSTKHETASRLRGRIERVLDAARARGHRLGENPARWRGHLDHLLPRRQKLTRGHHAAMPYPKVSGFVGKLREREAVSAAALELLILAAARSGEVMGATWSEFDLDRSLWTVPANRMKAGREHRVPLSTRAVEIVEAMKPLRGKGDFVFPGQRAGSPLSVMALQMLMRRLKAEDATPHGFRSSFRDWVGEATEFPRELAEAALAHTVGNATERAYRRGDALERRRKLMDAWAAYCSAPPEAADEDGE